MWSPSRCSAKVPRLCRQMLGWFRRKCSRKLEMSKKNRVAFIAIRVAVRLNPLDTTLPLSSAWQVMFTRMSEIIKSIIEMGRSSIPIPLSIPLVPTRLTSPQWEILCIPSRSDRVKTVVKYVSAESVVSGEKIKVKFGTAVLKRPVAMHTTIRERSMFSVRFIIRVVMFMVSALTITTVVIRVWFTFSARQTLNLCPCSCMRNWPVHMMRNLRTMVMKIEIFESTCAMSVIVLDRSLPRLTMVARLPTEVKVQNM